MADLEELGYIEQPHTSAGRIPSDLGYRYYVDWLMEKEKLKPYEEEYIHQVFSQKMQQIESVIRQASEILSQISNYTAIILGPQLGKRTFQRIELLPLVPGKALMIIIINSRFIQHHIIDIPESITQSDIERISMVLNSKLHGYTLDQVKKATMKEIYEDLTHYKSILTTILDMIEHLNTERTTERVYLGGTLNIFNQPEFKDIDKVKNLLSVLEKDEILIDLLEANDTVGLSIKIGGENKYEGINNCSLITSTYQVSDEIVGSIGILGPTRMPYSKAVSLVECVTVHLTRALEKLLK